MANPGNPFGGFDPRSFMDMGKLGATPPSFDMGALVEAQRRNLEALTRANQVAAEGMQALAQRHAEMLRQGLDQAGQALRALMAAGSPEDKAAQQADIARDGFEQAMANARELVEIATRAQSEAGDVLAQRVASSLTELKSAIASGQKTGARHPRT
jgi:phasin family protein